MLVMSLGLLFPPVHCPPPFFLFWALFCSSVSPRTVPIVISHVFFPSFPFFAWQILIYIFSLAHHPVCLFSPRCHQPGAFSGPLSISYLPMLPFPSQPQSFLLYFPARYLTLAYFKPLISKQSFSTWSDVCLCLQPKVEICVCLSGTCFVLSTL